MAQKRYAKRPLTSRHKNEGVAWRACEVGEGMVVQMFQIRFALQLHCGAQSRHRAAGKAFCHAGKVIAQLQHLLQLPHLHLIGGCRPVRQQSCLSNCGDMQPVHAQ